MVKEIGIYLVLLPFWFLVLHADFFPVVIPLQAQGIEVSDTGLTKTAEEAGFEEAEDIEVIIGWIIRAVLGFLGFVFFVMALYAGILWMTAGGNAEQIKKARGMLTNGVIGLVIVSSAYAIATYVIGVLSTAETGT